MRNTSITIILIAATGLWACKKSDGPSLYDSMAKRIGIKFGYPYYINYTINGIQLYGNKIVFNANRTITETLQNDSITYPIIVTAHDTFHLLVYVPNDTGANSPFAFYHAACQVPNDTVTIFDECITSYICDIYCEFHLPNNFYLQPQLVP